jgi:hypothetical protein
MVVEATVSKKRSSVEWRISLQWAIAVFLFEYSHDDDQVVWGIGGKWDIIYEEGVCPSEWAC